MTQMTRMTQRLLSAERARADTGKNRGDVICVIRVIGLRQPSQVFDRTIQTKETDMTRKAMNFLKKQLRDEGKLPRSMRQVKAEFRKSGKILPPYERTEDQPAATVQEPVPALRTADKPTAITPIEYGGLQQAYDHFNKELFGGSLPDVFITYQRRANSGGYFSPDRFSGRVDELGRHELALNPDGFIGRTDEWINSVLNHEMSHVWQHVHGKPSSRGYHNKEWAAKMKQLGLQPSSTGMVGGKETGQRMMHYIIPDGAFQKSYQRLAATGWRLNLQSTPVSGPKGGKNSKTKFTCPQCGQNTWGKPGARTDCDPCVIAALEAAGKLEAATIEIIESVRMRSTESADAEVAAAA
jgi:predicted SprT family Zn-dependent metalloprotease